MPISATRSPLSGSGKCSSYGNRAASPGTAPRLASARAATASPCRRAARVNPMSSAAPSHIPGHIPVLVGVVLAALAPRDDATYIDATFGAGGYSEAILGAARCRVFGIDRDPDAVARGQALADRHGGRLTLIAGPFGDMERLIGPFSPRPIAGIAFDLGVSSMQLDEATRGFSFRQDGPLDMRMSRDGANAAHLLARVSERELGELIRTLGEERFAGRVAHAIAAAQQRRPLATTCELAEIVRAAVPRREPGIDSA